MREISVTDLVLLSAAAIRAAEDEFIGECHLHEPVARLLEQLPKVALTDDQYDNLLFLFREACSEGVGNLSPEDWFKYVEKNRKK